jgi:hypothetical protein
MIYTITSIFLSFFAILLCGYLLYKVHRLQRQFKIVRRDFAIVEQLLAPFMEWVNDVKKMQAQNAKLAQEKTDALSRIKEKKADQ